jgi:hypothetical protein
MREHGDEKRQRRAGRLAPKTSRSLREALCNHSFHHHSDVVSAAPPTAATFAVQIRYPRSEWVTLACIPGHRAAVRRAAAAYRDAVSPKGALPSQVRLLEVPAAV